MGSCGGPGRSWRVSWAPWGLPERSLPGVPGVPRYLGRPLGAPWGHWKVAGRVQGALYDCIWTFLAALEAIEKPFVFIKFSDIGRARGGPGLSLGSLRRAWGNPEALGEAPREATSAPSWPRKTSGGYRGSPNLPHGGSRAPGTGISVTCPRRVPNA